MSDRLVEAILKADQDHGPLLCNAEGDDMGASIIADAIRADGWVRLADADLEAIARAFLGPYYGDRGTVKDFYGQVRVALYAGFHKVVPGE